MPDANADPSFPALLRQAGYYLPQAVLADLERGHALLRDALARIGKPPPTAEPATIFRPSAAP